MNIHRVGKWNCRGGHGKVFRYIESEHNHRIGQCGFTPSDGDLCIRVADAGDCFHTYISVRKTKDGRYVRVGEFGAYIFGKEVCTLSERKFHLICAGELVEIP